MRTHRAAISRVAFGVALVAVACAETGERNDKVGNPSAPATLTLATSEQVGRPGGDIVERFVAAVDELSGGHLTIAPTFDHATDQPLPTDQLNIQSLRAGDFDLTLLPARAWHSDGVTSLEPLQLPFVVETDEQADRVAADPELSDALLAGLATIDVTGLGLFPEGLRHLVRLDGTPINSTGDLGGLTVRAPTADTTWAVLDALGADVVDLSGPALNDAVVSGHVDAAETSLVLTSTLPAIGRPSVLANVSLYTKFDVLAISNTALAGLDERAATALRDAAKTALKETLAERPREAEALADACRAGVATVSASAAERQALQDRLKSVVQRVSTAAGIESLLQRVRDVAGEAPEHENAGCPPAETTEDSRAIDATKLRPIAGELPNGTYRFAVDPKLILAAYPDFPEAKLVEYSGVFTAQLDDGHLTLDVLADDGSTGRYTTVYEVHGNVVTFAFASGIDFHIPMAVQWRWMTKPGGSLSFEPVGGQDRGVRADYTDLWTIPAWERIG